MCPSVYCHGRKPQKIFANETLYQLSYTPEVFRLPWLQGEQFELNFNPDPPISPLIIFRQLTSVQKVRDRQTRWRRANPLHKIARVRDRP
jgi:hypothetical protein